MPTLDLNKIKIYDAGNTVVDRYTIIFVNRKTRGPLCEALASSANRYRLGKRLTPGRSTRAGATIC